MAVGGAVGGWRLMNPHLHLVWLGHLGFRGVEDDLVDADALRVLDGAGLVWVPSSTWIWIGGLFVASIGDHVLPVPVAGGVWRPDPRWTVLLVPVQPSVLWKPLPTWTFSAGAKFSLGETALGRYAFGEYELDDRDPDGDAIVYSDLRVFAKASWGGRHGDLGLEGGWAMARRFQWLGDDHRDQLRLD
jgi:hypothetical protein